MKSIAFVIPYFGHFPNYFDKWLKSCSYNSTIDWIIFTDCHEEYDYPINVHVNYCTFEDIKVRFQSKFDFKISLNKPYKLCDYKCAYGYIFEKELEKYDFWGYCDVDLIWGDIRKFVTDDLLENYCRVGVLGHCSILLNDDKINRLFKRDYSREDCTIPNYKWVYTSKMSFCFDEGHAFNKFFPLSGITITPIDRVFDVNIKFKGFIPAKHIPGITYDNTCSFKWINGKLYAQYYINKKIVEIEIAYAHFQKRALHNCDINTDCFWIVPDHFQTEPLAPTDLIRNDYKKTRNEYWKIIYRQLKGELMGYHRYYHYKYPWLYKFNFLR